MKSKKSLLNHGVGIAIAVISTAIALSPRANAISLVYETGPLAGTPFVSGPIEFVFTGVGAGTVYNPFGAVGSTVGDGTPGGGVGLLNGLGLQPANPININEDQYGVVSVVNIKDAITNAVIWSPLGKNQQLVGTYYGGTDFWGRQDAIGLNATQTTVQTGFTINLYEQTPFAPSPDFSSVTPALRGLGSHLTDNVTPNAADFALFTEDQNGLAAPNLTLALSLTGVAGFLDPSAGLLGATSLALQQNVEIQSTFISSVGGQGNAQGFLAVNPLLGSGAQIDNNQFNALYNSNTADARFTFTQQTLPGANPWDVNVNGPAQTLVVSVPEPGSVLAGILCIGSLLGSRRRKTATA